MHRNRLEVWPCVPQTLSWLRGMNPRKGKEGVERKEWRKEGRINTHNFWNVVVPLLNVKEQTRTCNVKFFVLYSIFTHLAICLLIFILTVAVSHQKSNFILRATANAEYVVVRPSVCHTMSSVNRANRIELVFFCNECYPRQILQCDIRRLGPLDG